MEKQYKLTLSVKPDTAKRAKRYARKRNTSVTRLVEDYLDRLTDQEKKPLSDEEFLKSLHPSVRAIVGIMTKEEMQKAKKKLRGRLKKKLA